MSVIAQFGGPVQTDAANRFRMFQSMARSHQGSGQSVSDRTQTALTLDTNDFNTDSMWTSGMNTRLTSQIAGKYLVVGGVSFSQNTTGDRAVQIRKNGSTFYGIVAVTARQSGPTQIIASDVLSLAANDYVEIVVYQSGGGPLSTDGTTQNFGAMLYVGE